MTKKPIILDSRYSASQPMLVKYGGKLVHYNKKKEHEAFIEWLNNTYSIRYKDIKEGDLFILWNGVGVPVPFRQMKDEIPDKYNRPTRLLDGSYLGLSGDARVTLAPHEDIVALKKEILEGWK